MEVVVVGGEDRGRLDYDYFIIKLQVEV